MGSGNTGGCSGCSTILASGEGTGRPSMLSGSISTANICAELVRLACIVVRLF